MKTSYQLSETSNNINEMMHKLKHEDLALVGRTKNQPVLIYRHKHWHLLTLGCVVDQKFHAKRGISNINFMSSARARKYVTEELKYTRLAAFSDVFTHFSEELAAKVLPSAVDYRPLIQNEWVTLAGGFTTDTLSEKSIKDIDLDSLIIHLSETMKSAQAGPFLHFEKFYTAMIQK